MVASVSSLDQDMRKLRMSRYTPQAANEVRRWIEQALGESLPAGDLLDALKDGTVLCRLANLALPPPGIRFKKSNMPFMQMENISHFLRACEMSPLNLPAHDRFLTVDLYEAKDPAQVLQCLGAFSRVAQSLQPNRFPDPVGPKRGVAISPDNTGLNGKSHPMADSNVNARSLTPTVTGGSNTSRTTDTSLRGPVSSWSKKTDEGVTAPAWNIHQYGYMGGANQGSQGVAFGARRQITSAAPHVPSLAEKERMRREKAEEEERQRRGAESARSRRQADQEADEQRVRDEEERLWQERTNRQREEEKARMERQRQEWEEQERKWKADEEVRLREEQEIQQQLRQASVRRPPSDRTDSNSALKGQYLSQYQTEKQSRSRQASYNDSTRHGEKDRVADLERQLEEAKERERRYLQEREERNSVAGPERSKAQETTRPVSPPESNVSWAADEREFLRSKHTEHQQQRLTATTPAPAVRPLPDPASRPVPETPPSLPTRRDLEVPPTQNEASDLTPSLPSRPLPDPRSISSHTSSPVPAAQQQQPDRIFQAPRPLPTPSSSSSSFKPPLTPTYQARSPFTRPPLSSNSNPRTEASPSQPRTFTPQETSGFRSSESERALEDARRDASQQNTRQGGFAAKSLLEREMERERERQREWEEAQSQNASAKRDEGEGSGPGQSWDVNQYGFAGGDSQNRGSGPGSGIGFGGRRQIVGPRPAPGSAQGR